MDLYNVTFFVLLFIAAGSTATFSVEAAVTCETLENDLGPCITHVLIGVVGLPGGCCDGLRSLVSAAATRQDRQTACLCLMSVASTVSDDQLGRAANIPNECGVSIPFQISRDVDCSAVR